MIKEQNPIFKMIPENNIKPKRSRTSIPLASLLWLILLVGGLGFFMQYENRPGIAAEAPADWPPASRIERATDRATLVILAHPHCPCTRATIDELAKLMARLDGRLAVFVVFIKPEGVDADWEQSDTWMSAAQIPGVNVIRDDQGTEAQLFKARTSGQSLLYDKDGKLLFNGGITIGRGAEGDSAGASAIVSLINGEASPVDATSVFGCPLFSHDPDTKKEALNARSKR